jgi:hypothetical protein
VEGEPERDEGAKDGEVFSEVSKLKGPGIRTGGSVGGAVRRARRR